MLGVPGSDIRLNEKLALPRGLGVCGGRTGERWDPEAEAGISDNGNRVAAGPSEEEELTLRVRGAGDAKIFGAGVPFRIDKRFAPIRWVRESLGLVELEF